MEKKTRIKENCQRMMIITIDTFEHLNLFECWNKSLLWTQRCWNYQR